MLLPILGFISQSWAQDTTPPVATISTATASPTNTTGILFTITWSEPVTGFTLIDVLPSNATIYSFSGSGSTYTLRMDPASNGTSNISIPANRATDAAGNPNTATGPYIIIYDTVQPGAAITSTAANPTSAASFPITITFSESVVGFTNSDIAATNATLSNFSGSGATYTATVNPAIAGTGTISINVAANVASDAAGNTNTAASTFNINYIAPCSSSRIWIGSWIGGLPVADQPVIFLTNYTATSNLAACSMQINGPAVVTFQSGTNLTIAGSILVNDGGQLVMENNANLIQAGTLNNNIGTGVTVRRNASMRRLDYVYWSSPVESQNLQAFSPATLPGRFYTIDEQTNSFLPADPATSFALAKGYLVRAPNTYTDGPAQPFTGSFTGRPNNGTIAVPVTALGQGYNLIGNPYPSTVNADLFLADPNNQNIEALYFWTHLTNTGGGTNYATYNSTGATGATPSDTDPASPTPNGFIQTGQGFIAKVSSAGNATFANSMRAPNNGDQFFRNAPDAAKSRIWLNLAAAGGAFFNQAMVGYVPGATNGLDSRFDGKLIESTGTRLYSPIGGGEYAIQGRALPFENTDTAALGFKTAAEGTFTISLDRADGLFAEGQDIFLKDNLGHSITDIKNAPYTFTSASGTFNERFEIVYQNTMLGTGNHVLDAESIIAYKQNGSLQINAGSSVLEEVKVYDIQGRLLYQRNGIGTPTLTISSLQASQQFLILQVATPEGQTANKKILF